MGRKKRPKFGLERPKGFFQFYRQIYDLMPHIEASRVSSAARLLHLLYHYIPERS